MIESLPERLLFTAAFTFCAVWCVRELIAGRGWFNRISHGLHLLMSIAMALMMWPGPMRTIPIAPQVALFTAATLWFVGSMVWAARRRATGQSDQGAWHHLPHAIMMGAMAWHLQAMGQLHAAGGHGHGAAPGAAGHGAGHGASGHGAGHGAAGHGAGHGGHEMGSMAATPWWDTLWQVTGWVLFGALAVWGVVALVRAMRANSHTSANTNQGCVSGRGGSASIRLGHLNEAVMCLGMFVVTLPLLGTVG